MSDPIPEYSRGKWSIPGVPHRGWECISTRDLYEEGEEFTVCEMCEARTIRFVHRMRHPEYPTTLDCGRDCAGHMEGDRKRAEDRDTNMRRKASRRAHFQNRKGWRNSAQGNPYITIDGYRCVIFPRGIGFAIAITPPLRKKPYWGKRVHLTIKEAKEACFDATEHLKLRAHSHER